MALNKEHGDGADAAIEFGPFRLFPTQRLLFQCDRRVALGSRAVEILLFLIERHGTFVPNSDIISRVWPRSMVVDGNLRVHVTALR